MRVQRNLRQLGCCRSLAVKHGNLENAQGINWPKLSTAYPADWGQVQAPPALGVVLFGA